MVMTRDFPYEEVAAMDEYARQSGFMSVNDIGLGNKQHGVEGQRRSSRHRMRRRVPTAIIDLANHRRCISQYRAGNSLMGIPGTPLTPEVPFLRVLGRRCMHGNLAMCMAAGYFP